MAYAITISGSGLRFECARGHTVLQAMMLSGRSGISVGCRGGGCGVCKVRVLEGRYVTGSMSASCVSPEERELGMALACKLIPETDLRLDVVGKVAQALGRGVGRFHLYGGAVEGAATHSREG